MYGSLNDGRSFLITFYTDIIKRWVKFAFIFSEPNYNRGVVYIRLFGRILRVPQEPVFELCTTTQIMCRT